MGAVAALGASLQTGCSHVPIREAMPVPYAFKESAPAPGPHAPVPESPAAGAWWKVYEDDRLDALIAQALGDNPTIRIAAARLAQARALAGEAESGRFLRLASSGSVARQGGPLLNAAGAEGSLNLLGLNLAYEIDLFGRLKHASEAASLDARSKASLLESARLLLQAELTQTYLSLRALDAERLLSRRIVATHEDEVAIGEQRLLLGSVSEGNLLPAFSALAAARSDALSLEARRAALENALGALVGEPGLGLGEAARAAPLPVIPAGLPSEMLARRPDVAAALSEWQAADARLGGAQDAWLPTLTLTASGGHASSALADLLTLPTRFWSLGLGAALPLLDGGRRQAVVAAAQAGSDAAFSAHRERILQAFREVDDQLASLRSLAERSDVLATELQRTARWAESTRMRLENGSASRIDLLKAQRSELLVRRQALQLRSARQQATVGLVRALGGGWSAESRAQAGLPGETAALNKAR
jgi:multidrug efflux system outer membrane protein